MYFMHYLNVFNSIIEYVFIVDNNKQIIIQMPRGSKNQFPIDIVLKGHC